MAIGTLQQRENLAVAYAATALYASVHTADPGSTGASEVSGGTPTYARKPISWAAGTVDGSVQSTAMDFDVPTGTTITHVGIWSAASGGTFLDKAAVTSAAFASQGIYRLTLAYAQA